jgi:hypothetical protein
MFSRKAGLLEYWICFHLLDFHALQDFFYQELVYIDEDHLMNNLYHWKVFFNTNLTI